MMMYVLCMLSVLCVMMMYVLRSVPGACMLSVLCVMILQCVRCLALSKPPRHTEEAKAKPRAPEIMTQSRQDTLKGAFERPRR